MKTVEVRIPHHEHSMDGKHSIECPGSGDIRTIRMTKRRTHFKCPTCGQVFSVMENLHTSEQETKPECRYSHQRGYICSVSGLNLLLEKGEIYCPNHCHGCESAGRVFEDVKYDQGFVPGFYVETTPLPRKTGKGGKKKRIPPATMLKTLGCKGIVMKEDANLLSHKLEDIAEFEHGEELHDITPIGNDLYDIGHGRFWLYHKYECLVTFDEHEQRFIKDKEASHVFCLIDKETYRSYVIPQKNKNVFGFSFKRGVLYKYIPQSGLRLADAQAFRDNTRFIGYKVKEVVRNTVTNKNEETYGYLVEEDKVDEFLSLTKRPTRIISSNDYSGVPQYDKIDLYRWKNRKGEAGIYEAIEENDIYQKFIELIKLDSLFEGNITEFNLIDPEEEQEERVKIWNSDEYLESRTHYVFGKYFVIGFNENITEFDIQPWSDEDYEKIKDLHKPIKEFIDKYCKGLSGKTEDVLYHLYCDAVDPDNSEFTRWLDNFNGGKENEERFKYSNHDLIQACKVKHVLKNVHITSEENTQAIQKLFDLGIKHPSYGNPLKRGKAQNVAFDYQNPDNEDDDFEIYENLGQLLKEDPDIKTAKLYSLKPQNQWSDKDYKKAAQGEDVNEISTIIMGVNVSKDDVITKHCLDCVNGNYTPLPLINICVSGSRVMPTALRTRYIKNDDVYGRGYFTPAVHVWKGYLTEKNIQVLFARIAPGSDCSAIIAALEINEELANRLNKGLITPEEYKEQSIKIVAILHGWYASATFNNHGLMSILHKVLHYGGYVLCNEPYREKFVTAVRYPKGITTHEVMMKVPVTVSNYEQLSSKVPRHNISVHGRSDKVDRHTPIYTYFDRRIERTNKLLVTLGSELVILCRGEYSGTTNTMHMAHDMGKEVIEITSPTREIPKRFRTDVLKPDEALKMYHRFCYLSENDPIQKGRSTPTYEKEVKESPQRKYNRMISPKIEAKFFYYKLAYISMESLNDHWNLWTFFKPQQYQLRGSGIMTSLRGQKHNHHEKISYIPMKEYMDKGRFDLWKFFEPQQYQLRDKYSSYYQVMKVVPATIKNYDKWSNMIASTVGNLRSRSTTSYIRMNYYVDSNHRDLCSIFN